jgi:hypothetical protein
MGLTARGKAPAKFKPKAFLGDESTLQMSEKTIKTLLKKADKATLNAVLQHHGIAYHWRTLTDALGRAFAAEWKDASDITGMPGSRGSDRAVLPRDTGGAGVDSRRPLPAFPGEKAAAGLEPGSNQVESFVKVSDLCRQHGISQPTYSTEEQIRRPERL